jgi:uncharacterized protein YndB with AHSA1/START domain
VKNTLQISTPTDREVTLTRIFNAPRTLVFAALTRPELLRRWFIGPSGWSMVVCEIDLRVGGSYRFLWRSDAGVDLGMRGVYRDIVPLERIVSTEVFDQSWYPGEALSTAVLIERASRTTLTTTLLYESKEARDTVLRSPMEQGVTANYDRLEDFLASSAAP